ncbi:hypothetical protein HF086_008286 [Spodoptera exigua]|uniref:P-type ATPase C-terminal domain-containing protein n=1 Tax=Spodoptera exigua TaxID=7107 RepID=A0A922MCM6_SPOEX|nr:hypothetical protein HF086_008286 [Spodoptera exigua]
MEEIIDDGEDTSDSEVIVNSQQEYEHIQINSVNEENSQEEGRSSVMKRKEREDDYSAEDDFITVEKRKPKKFNRSDSSEFLPNKRVDRNKNQNEQIEDINTYEVCITSMESLPKQMALAKLLRMENIKGISRIKYKSFNKVLLQFNKEEEANNLLSCQKFKDMGFRCQKRIETTQFEAEQVVETESGASQKEEVEKGNQQDEQLRYRFEFTKLILKMKGVGIEGAEGRAASLAGDVSVRQLSGLARLLLVHGRRAAMRSAALSLFIVHRGLIVSTMQVLDKDIPSITALRYPQLYKQLSKGRQLSYKSFYIWTGISIYQDGDFIRHWEFWWKVIVITLVSCLPLYIVKHMHRKWSDRQYKNIRK